MNERVVTAAIERGRTTIDTTSCACTWAEKRRTIARPSYHAYNTAVGPLSVNTEYATDPLRAASYVMDVRGAGPCQVCGQGAVTVTLAALLWRCKHDAARVTFGGLAEAHEWLVRQVVTGRLPPG